MGDPVRLCHALVIGVDRYEEGSADLSGCVAGARALAQVLADADYQVALLVSDAPQAHQRPTLDNIRLRLGLLQDLPSPPARVLFYFAGHGAQRDGAPHLLAEDAASAGWLPLREVEAALKASGAPQQVVLLDACHQGADVATPAARDEAAGLVVLAASTRAGVSADSGAFTRALVEGLSGKAAGPSGEVTFTDLWFYATARARSDPRALVRQDPTARIESLGDVVLLTPRAPSRWRRSAGGPRDAYPPALWEPFAPLPARPEQPVLREVPAVVLREGSLHLYGRDGAGRLWRIDRDRRGLGRRWEEVPSPAPLAQGPALCCDAAGRLCLAVALSDDTTRVAREQEDGRLGAFVTLAEPRAAAAPPLLRARPTLPGRLGGELELLLPGADGALWLLEGIYEELLGAWGDALDPPAGALPCTWLELASGQAGAVAYAASGAEGLLCAVLQDELAPEAEQARAQLRLLRADPALGWISGGEWRPLGAPGAAGPALVARTPAHLDVFAVAPAGNLLQRSFRAGAVAAEDVAVTDEGWSTWVTHEGPLLRPGLAAWSPDGESIEVLGLGVDGQLWLRRWL